MDVAARGGGGPRPHEAMGLDPSSYGGDPGVVNQVPDGLAHVLITSDHGGLYDKQLFDILDGGQEIAHNVINGGGVASQVLRPFQHNGPIGFYERCNLGVIGGDEYGVSA